MRSTALGVDPGASGALVALCVDGGHTELTCYDMPVVTVGKRARARVSPVDLADLLAQIVLMQAPSVAVVERVSAMPQDGNTSAFAFGYAYGVVLTAIASVRIAVESPLPREWKAALKVPVTTPDIIARANELLPSHSAVWRGPRGGMLHNRAEAALLALYGVRLLQRNTASLITPTL
jgi:Holliday junction resolvasome RuvABC endonuclease subunit